MARSLRASILAGAAAGLAGTWAMTEFQGWWSRAIAGDNRRSAGGDQDARGWQERSEDQNANELMAQRIAAHTIERPLTRDELALAAPAVHYAFGTLMGALFGAAAWRVHLIAPATGAAFGTAVWIAADEIAMPALRLSRPDVDYPADVHLQAFASHVVFGVTTELAYLALAEGGTFKVS
jgi:hypothetical protein